MLYYFVLPLPFLLVFGRLLLTNFIIPHSKKKALYNTLKRRSDWDRIEKTEQMLTYLFKGVHAKLTSKTYRFLRLVRNKEFIYGEIDFLSFYTMLEKAEPSDQTIFYDLGAGAGKAVFTAGLFFNVSKACGLELLPPLCNTATSCLRKAANILEEKDLERTDRIQFIQEDFLQYDFSDADIIYVAATCLSDATWEKLTCKLADLKSGSRVIVATKTIQHENFDMIYQGVHLMSWGLCPVRIYKLTRKK